MWLDIDLLNYTCACAQKYLIMYMQKSMILIKKYIHTCITSHYITTHYIHTDIHEECTIAMHYIHTYIHSSYYIHYKYHQIIIQHEETKTAVCDTPRVSPWPHFTGVVHTLWL